MARMENQFHPVGTLEMLELHKSYVLNKQQQPIAVQIAFAEFE